MPSGLASGREVAESAFEALLLEAAAHYASPNAAQAPKAALESIGFQVGLQLVERCVGGGGACACRVCACACACARNPSVVRQRCVLLACAGGAAHACTRVARRCVVRNALLAAWRARCGAARAPHSRSPNARDASCAALPTSYSRDKPRFGEHLEAIKFLCKEFWSELFKKQVDNLKTNYRVRSDHDAPFCAATSALTAHVRARACTC
jgi:hypothetical protein